MQELNIIIRNEFTPQEMDLIHHLFGDEPVVFLDEKADMYDCLIMLGVFPSKGEARKNWKRTGKEITPGYNEFRGIGKSKKALFIWNPVDTRGVAQ